MSAQALDLPLLHLSRYVHAHPVADGVVALYHPFGHEVAIVPEQCWDLLKSSEFEPIPDDIFADLAQRKFLVPPRWDETVLDAYATQPIAGFFSLWLIVAQTCNIGCTYCVVEADTQTDNLPQLPVLGKVPHGRMTTEVAEAALEVFRKSLQRHRQQFARVTLYGGEPLINRPLLKHIIPLIRSLDWEGREQPTEILCFTNGYLYDETLTEVFLQNDVTVGISLDGPKVVNDRARVTRDGSGTYDKIVASYRRYVDAGVRVGLSCTLGNHTQGELLNIVSHFIDDLEAPSVQFQVPIQVPDGSPNYLDMASIARETLEAFALARNAGVEEGLAMRRLTSFASGRFHYRDCAAVGGELAVSPDGTTGPCHNATIGGEQYFKGNVLDAGFNPEASSNFMEWHTRMPINMPGCHGCFAIGLCGGGCPYNALVATGSIWQKDPQQCGYMEQLIDWILEDVWSRLNGHDGTESAPPQRQSARNRRGPVPLTLSYGAPGAGLGH